MKLIYEISEAAVFGDMRVEWDCPFCNLLLYIEFDKEMRRIGKNHPAFKFKSPDPMFSSLAWVQAMKNSPLDAACNECVYFASTFYDAERKDIAVRTGSSPYGRKRNRKVVYLYQWWKDNGVTDEKADMIYDPSSHKTFVERERKTEDDTEEMEQKQEPYVLLKRKK